MKIAVYTIAKNEEQFVQRWYESAKDADYLCILDTGSQDQTVSIGRGLGICVEQEVFVPWRFDHARNRSLDLVPADADICVALDMDEVLVEGWREHLEQALADGVTRPRYKYTWSWENGRPGLQYGGDKIHARHGYYWKHPVHEVLMPNIDEVQGWYDLEIHHHPDTGKSRGHYLPLLELAVKEDPEDDRNSHYLAREYLFAGRNDEAVAEFKRHLTLEKAVWGPERARSYRYLAQLTDDPGYLWNAVAEDPTSREAWLEISQACHDEGEWVECFHTARRALQIVERPLTYLTEGWAWGSRGHDLAAVAAFKIGLYQEAEFHGLEALKLDPYDARLRDNIKFYRRAAA